MNKIKVVGLSLVFAAIAGLAPVKIHVAPEAPAPIVITDAVTEAGGSGITPVICTIINGKKVCHPAPAKPKVWNFKPYRSGTLLNALPRGCAIGYWCRITHGMAKYYTAYSGIVRCDRGYHRYGMSCVWGKS